MKSGQFVRGKIDGIQKHFESTGTDRLLPAEKLNELKDYDIIGEPQQRFFQKERVLAKTIVTAAENSDGRRGGVVNHTVLYQFDKSVTHETIKYTFDTDTFISDLLQGKRKFKMPPMPQLPDSDAGAIDAPPPIAWEV